MPFYIIQNDITNMRTDAIVNAANCSLQMGGGVSGAIFKAAGIKKLQAECDKIGNCRTGEAVITSACSLPAKFIIHTPGPMWRAGTAGEISLLYNSYINSLTLAAKHNCRSISFPLVSSGIYGFPKDIALKTAISAITNFLQSNEMEVYLVIYESDPFPFDKKRYNDIKRYMAEKSGSPKLSFSVSSLNREEARLAPQPAFSVNYSEKELYKKPRHSLKDAVSHLDESFSEMLLRLIDEKRLTDIETYKKANIDRKLFSKIRSSKKYNPSKNTALAFAVALHLNVDDTLDLLKKAGYTLSGSNKFDVIIRYHIEHNIYNIHEINEALFAFEQPLLGR